MTRSTAYSRPRSRPPTTASPSTARSSASWPSETRPSSPGRRSAWTSSSSPPGGLDDDVHAERRPGELGRVSLGQDAELLAVDGDAVVGGLDLGLEYAVDRVILQQM